MRDYMTALQRRFHIVSERTVELGHDVETAYNALRETLTREQKKLLLRISDAETRFRDEEKLDSFFSGFRLADGIHRELGSVPPYSFEDEDEQQAREIFEQEIAETTDD